MLSLSCACLLQEFERSRAFGFLNEVKKRFQTTYGSRAQTALPYAMNSEFSGTLAAQMVLLHLYTPAPVCAWTHRSLLITSHKGYNLNLDKGWAIVNLRL